MKEVIDHYDMLIDENNDPVNDSKALQEHMNKWDGPIFINQLNLTSDKNILEIGVGTGRIAIKICDKGKSFTGIDISPKTIQRAKQHLSSFSNIELINDDFLTYSFKKKYDVIYSTLTFMHISDKRKAISKVAQLLNSNGRFVLSIDKNQDNFLTFKNSQLRVFPDQPAEIAQYINDVELYMEQQLEAEFAYIFVAVKKSMSTYSKSIHTI